MSHILSQAAARAERYLRDLSDRSVQPSTSAVSRLRELDFPLPNDPSPPEVALRLLDEAASGATVASAGPRYLCFVTGGSLPAALAANWLATAWDQNAHFIVGSPAAAQMENVALGWLLSVLSLPKTWGGGFVTGTTMGNFAALAAARGHILKEAGWDVESDGLFGAPPINVVVGEEAHSTLLKALAMLGLGSKRVVRVEADSQGRIRPGAIPRLSGPSIVCLQAGNVNTGAVDAIEPAVETARQVGAWVHVDGAFGLWAAASPARAHLVSGIDQVDSIATDLHKWLNVPYDNGLVLFQRPEAGREAMSIRASYLPDEPGRQPCDYTPESSRRARGVDVWAALYSLGRSGLSDLVERCCRYAARFAEGLTAAGFEILNDVVLNQVLVRFGNDEVTRTVVSEVQRDGSCWCGGTIWKGRAAMRISVSSWATTEEDVEKSLDSIVRIAREVVDRR